MHSDVYLKKVDTFSDSPTMKYKRGHYLINGSYICKWTYCLKLCIVYLRKGRYLLRITYYKIKNRALSHLSVAISTIEYTVSNYA